MQLVSLQHLKALAKGKDQVSEYEISDKFSYDDFKIQYSKDKSYVEKMHKSKGYDSNRIVSDTYEQIKKTWLKDHCPPIKYVGEGSSRAAFACLGGKCLKIAMTNAGLDQNETEFYNAASDYRCFAQTYDADTHTYGSILTECCTDKLDKNYIQRLYGIGDDFLYILTEYVLVWLAGDNFFIEKAIDRQTHKIEQLETDMLAGDFPKWRFDEFKDAVGLLKRIKTDKDLPQYAVLDSLISFYIDHGRTDDDLLIEDLTTSGNWGMAIRNGEIVPVIIDAGFSTQVKHKHYSH